MKVYIEGRLQTSEWTGQDGAKRQRTEIIADNMIILTPKGSGANDTNFNRNNEEEIISADNNDDEIKIEDIPF